MSESQKVPRLDLSTATPAPDAVPTSFSEAPSKQTKRLHQLKPLAKIDLTTHGPVRPEPKPEAASRPERAAGNGAPRGRRNAASRDTGGRTGPPQHGGGQKRRQQDDRRQGGRQQSNRQHTAPAPASSGSTLADLLSADVLAKLRGK